MLAFHSKFPLLAARETRSAFITGRNDLPDGYYGFIEFYCDEADCDCRRVMFTVISTEFLGEILATINFGWETVEFYTQWSGDRKNANSMVGASLAMISPQSRWAPKLLELCQFILRDSSYVERLQQHYRMFKDMIPQVPDLADVPIVTTKQNRNQSCSCGSGRKYKYCCGKR